ncbi:hypothetical protein [Thermophilibacter provencensis]|uniref:hypothetical protein n=1 Tax=Thermophilibacter provencensis TaxID=1852386 RepID=UPI00094B66B9|nr:hypothetical protein [Thermophilibacter provencensis]
MKKQLVLAAACALAISMPLVGCGGNGGGTASTGDDAAQSQSGGDFDAVEAYYGQWHGYVEITGETVYGTSGGVEAMLDVYLEQDGSCSVEPTEAHSDLLTDEGTWEATEGEITLHLTDGDIVMTVTSDEKAEANAADFGIADFDTILFDFYG